MEMEEGNKKEDKSSLIVMWSSLLPLLSKCQTPGCSAAVAEDNMEKYFNGAALDVKLLCDSGHQNHWSNSQKIEHKKKKVPILNIKLTVYLYLSGLSFQVFKAFCIKMDIVMFSTTTWYRYLNSLVYPVIYTFWVKHQASNIKDAMDIQDVSGGVKMAGDARFDSPGYYARYGTYFMQDLETRKVLGVYVAMKHQVSNSGEMKYFGLRTLLNCEFVDLKSGF